MPTDAEFTQFDYITAQAGEHFADYLLVVRARDGAFVTYSTNRGWAEGVMRSKLRDWEARDAAEIEREVEGDN